MGERKQRNRWLLHAATVMLAAGIVAEGFSCGGSGNSGTLAASSGHTGHGGAGGNIFVTNGTGMGGSVQCTVPCDAMTQVCSHGTCVPKTPCKTDNDCQNDTKCDPMAGCVPWDGQMPPHDPGCINVSTPGILQPKVRCAFDTVPPGDSFPGHIDVQGTPIVVNFNTAANPGPPSIAASFTATVINNYTEDLGVIRVLRGTDCSLEVNLGGVDLDGDNVVDWPVSSPAPAAGDFEGAGPA